MTRRGDIAIARDDEDDENGNNFKDSPPLTLKTNRPVSICSSVVEGMARSQAPLLRRNAAVGSRATPTSDGPPQSERVDRHKREGWSS